MGLLTFFPVGKRTDQQSLTGEPDRPRRRGTWGKHSCQFDALRSDRCHGRHSTLCRLHQSLCRCRRCIDRLPREWHSDCPSNLCPYSQGTMMDYPVSLMSSSSCRLTSFLRPLYHLGFNPVFHCRQHGVDSPFYRWRHLLTNRLDVLGFNGNHLNIRRHCHTQLFA